MQSAEICGERQARCNMRKGSEWWCEEVSVAVAKRDVHIKCGYKRKMRCRMSNIKYREIEQEGCA